ncbi:hypothetical protein CtesDRAFT_PD2102 [Comamonas testosteroni KF-1]|uniref:Uncharacterized protein n=1 Tax=Comamonas testosteroni (strain DSM 14576 / KF-1) TaxID=399795 RepID=B7WRH1_COMTK|nr:hypothetical protein CtesDRAFT_PD2102 [Comamonas testosteroni KF-1]
MKNLPLRLGFSKAAKAFLFYATVMRTPHVQDFSFNLVTA